MKNNIPPQITKIIYAKNQLTPYFIQKAIKSLYLILAFLAINVSAHAGILDSIFGYKNSDECILDKMKGTTSDTAATLIYKACAKYDEIDESSCSKKITIPNLTGNGAPDGYGRFSATIYNGSNIYTITKIDLRISGKNGKTDFNRVLQGKISIRPLSNGSFNELLGANSLTDMSWSIEQVYGCAK